MHSYRFLFLATCLLIGFHTSCQQVTSPANDTVTTETESCITAKNISGICVIRKLCDYGTIAVDKTLYSKQGYTRPCPMDKVCCPTEYVTQAAKEEPQKEFSFDED